MYRLARRAYSWSVLRVNHVAVATGDASRLRDVFQNVLGLQTSEAVPMPEHGVTTFFVDVGNVQVELVEPLGENGPLASFLKKSPAGGLHHLCLEVDHLDEAVRQLKLKNVRLLSQEPRVGAHGKPVIFLHPKDCGGILIELQQTK